MKLLEEVDIFITLMVVIVAEVYTYAQTYHIVSTSYVQFFWLPIILY